MEDFIDLVPEYWEEYLKDRNAEDIPYPMSALEDAYEGSSVREIMEDAIWGYSFDDNERSFDLYAEYFAYNTSNGHLVSISENAFEDYLFSIIDENEFMEWYKENYGED